MGKLFSIDAATKATITDALDDIITEFKKDCLLVYPARYAPCLNCIVDPQTKLSTNRWRSGGPQRFLTGTCPMCSGKGTHMKAEEQSEEVEMKVEWDEKRFWVPFAGIKLRADQSVCQTKFFITLVPKIARASHMVVQLPIAPFMPTRFELAGSPVSPGNIIQDRYAVATWVSTS